MTGASHPFSTFALTRDPIDLGAHGYVEEEYFLSGEARPFDEDPETGAPVHAGPAKAYATRVLVRRPVHGGSGTTWLSILNASQGYDIEDDWRRAWNEFIRRGDTYVALTAKPINVDALKNYDPQRYAALSFGGPTPGIIAEPGGNPFQLIETADESLAWEIIAATGRWLRSGENLPTPREVMLMGQSQSGAYTNAFLTHFHRILRREGNAPVFDAYLPGVAGCFARPISQSAQATADAPVMPLPEIVDIDVPVIAVSTDADIDLFTAMGGDVRDFRNGDGPLRRHWHVSGVPHSDARSRVIPTNEVIAKAGRLGRDLGQDVLDGLDIAPVEPVIAAAMDAAVKWVREGVPAAPSVWFDVDPDDPESPLLDEHGARLGGVRLGLVENAVMSFEPASKGNPVIGAMSALPKHGVLDRYPDFDAYRASCDEVDAELVSSGYLTESGVRLLHAVEDEMWRRVTAEDHAAPITPQLVGARS